MIRRAFASALVLLHAAPVSPAAAQAQPSPEPRYFEERAGWRASWGTDAALTLASLEGPATNRTNDGTTNFDDLWLRFHGDAGYGDVFELHVDVFATHEHRPSLFGLYARLQPVPQFGVRAGLLPLPVGAWQDRAAPSRQPLVNQPLSAQYLLSLRADSIPSSPDELLAQRGRGRDARYSLGRAGTGSALAQAYEHCWDTGLEALGRLGRVRYRVALTEGTPGSPAGKVRSRKSGAGLAARLTVDATAALRLGGSWSRGPYLLEDVAPFLPAGDSLDRYRQELVGADARIVSGALELHAEWMLTHFGTPFVSQPLRTHGYTLEANYALAPGLRLAARLSGLRSSRIAGATGASRTWDADADRLEAGLAYRFAGDRLALKAVGQRTRVALDSGRREDVAALQVSYSR